ncbi:MAG: integrating conjugative element protein [Alteromonadaceae bacterium]|nr:integrating conjugative element protein [Alteromonadaceae bacterium]
MEICNRSISFAKRSRKSGAICIISLTALTSFSTVEGAVADFSFEQLIEIGRVGKTIPAQKYYQNVDIKEVKINVEKSKKLLGLARASISADIFFPLKPETMRSGLLSGYRFDTSRSVKPFAVVGADPLSLRWLTLRKEKLIKLNAPIFVIEANSFNDLKKLMVAYKGLRFVPSSGDGIGKGLKINTYPFLVTSMGVWQ